MRCDLSVRWLRVLQPRPSEEDLDLTSLFGMLGLLGWLTNWLPLALALTDNVPRGLEAFGPIWTLGSSDGDHSLSVLQIHALQLRYEPVRAFRGTASKQSR